MAEYLGRGACEGCGKPVEVYADRNKMAYYKCGPCGRKVTHSVQRESARFVAKIDRHADPEDTAAPAKLPAPAKAAAASPDLPVPDRAPPPPPAPPAKTFFGFGS
jgi:DNA-directed RNA polymerase subunit RPC12/RpoP